MVDKKKVLRKLNDYRNVLRNKQQRVVNDPKTYVYLANKMEGLTVAINIVNSMEERKK